MYDFHSFNSRILVSSDDLKFLGNESALQEICNEIGYSLPSIVIRILRKFSGRKFSYLRDPEIPPAILAGGAGNSIILRRNKNQ